MGKTSIEWTDESWPIVNGCRRVSPGCVNCYAERLAATRLKHLPKYRGLAVYGRGWTGESRLWEPDLDMPLRLRKPSRIFVADMGDLFYEGVPDAVIDRVWATMLLAPQHTFQVLTKRAARMRAYLSDPGLYVRVLRAADAIRRARPKLTGVGISNPATFPAPWIWCGVSVESQKYADERIPHLLDVPARVRFLSCEPLLGPLDLWAFMSSPRRDESLAALRAREPHPIPRIPGVDWVIVGGESGPGARPFDLAWARSLVAQCKAAGVAAFVKQVGAVPVGDWGDGRLPLYDQRNRQWVLRDSKGGDPDEWPEDLRVREMPEVRRG